MHMERTHFEEDDPPPDEGSEPGGTALLQSTPLSRSSAGPAPDPDPSRKSSGRSRIGDSAASITSRRFVSLFPEHLSAPSALTVSGRTSPHIRWFRKRFYPDAANAQWNDWRWQLARRIRTMEELQRILPLTEQERQAFLTYGNRLPVSITPYYASLIDAGDPEHPLRRTVVPTIAEAMMGPGEEADPLHEDGDSPVPGLVHRYPDRVLFLVTDFCSDLLPLLHPVAHGRTPRRRSSHATAVGEGGRLHRGASRDPGRAALRRRSADPRRTKRWSGCSPACGAFPTWRSSGSAPRPRGAAPADHPCAGPMLKQYHPLWISIHAPIRTN